MRVSSIIGGAAAVASVAANPFKLPDGFPDPSPAQIASIQKKAGGSLPNGPLPSSLKPGGVTSLQLVVHNEIFETAFFTSLLNNITEGKPGYTPDTYAPLTKSEVIKIIDTVKNQEELHAISVNAALKNSKQEPIKPCEYKFPVTTYLEAVTLANTFTDLVLSTLPQAQALFGKDAGDEAALVPLFGSVIAQEGEQNGFYRLVQKKTPSAAPFLTGGAPPFAWTAVQSFIKPNSCPQPLSNVKLPTFKALDVVTKKPTPETKSLEFSIPKASISSSSNSLVYLSGQNIPVTEKIYDIAHKGDKTTFKANFPFNSGLFANGLTIGALVKGTQKFSSAADVAAATLNGPGLIEVN